MSLGGDQLSLGYQPMHRVGQLQLVGHAVYTLLKRLLGPCKGLLAGLAVAAQVLEIEHLCVPLPWAAVPQEGRVETNRRSSHAGCTRRRIASIEDLTPMKSTPALSSLQPLMGGSTETTSSTQ